MQLLKDIQDDVKEFVDFTSNVNGEMNLEKFKTLIEAMYHRMRAYLRYSCEKKYGNEVKQSLNKILNAKGNDDPIPERYYKSYTQQANVEMIVKGVLQFIVYKLGSNLVNFSMHKENEDLIFFDNCLSDIVDATEKGLKSGGKPNIKLDKGLKTMCSHHWLRK